MRRAIADSNLRKRAASLLAFLGCVLVLMVLVPVLIGALFFSTPSKQEFTVEFLDMPGPFRERLEFEVAAPSGRGGPVRCTALVQAPETQDRPEYRCEFRQRLFPWTEVGVGLDFFPRAQGWQPAPIRDWTIQDDASDLYLYLYGTNWGGALAILLAVVLYRWTRPVAQEGTRAAFPAALGWWALVLLATGVAGWLLRHWIAASDVEFMEQVLEALRAHPVGTVLALVVVAPVLEELVFRGLGWQLLRRAFSVPVVVILTTATFTMGHWYGWAGMLSVLIYGFGLALIRVKTGSLAWCIAAHAAINAGALTWLHFNH